MAFTVETGAGVPGANAYIDVAYADTYHEDRGQFNWKGTLQEKQAAIIRASEYVDKRFGPRFRGVRQSKPQGLEWPRLDAFDNDDFTFDTEDLIPRNLKKAIAEYALRALRNGELAPDPAMPVKPQDNADPNQSSGGEGTGGVVEQKRQKVGPIETEVKYRSAPPGQGGSSVVSDGFIPAYPAADLWIEELLRSSVSRTLSRG